MDPRPPLTQLGLIDEYRIFIHPVLVGGRPVFSDANLRRGIHLASSPQNTEETTRRLVESRIFDNQVVVLRHELAEPQP